MCASRLGHSVLALTLLAATPALAQPSRTVESPALSRDEVARDIAERIGRPETDWRRYGPVRVSIDPAIDDQRLVLRDGRRGERPTSAVVDARGVISRFITNELMIEPRNPQELRSFLQRTGGEVIDTDAIPEPPLELRGHARPVRGGPTLYVVRIDPARLPAGSLASAAQASGLGGEIRVSDESGERVLAAMLAERQRGLSVWVNSVSTPGYGVNATNEGGSGDAFTFSHFSSGLGASSLSNVTRAWRLMEAGFVRQQVSIAIIDGGFFLVNRLAGDAATQADFGQLPHQFDIGNNSYDAGGANTIPCQNNVRCLWHGQGVAGTALAIANNGQGTAGVAGFIASTPIFIRGLGSESDLVRAIRLAVAWGADVINISGSHTCSGWCHFWAGPWPLYTAVLDAEAAGVAVVAGAGNNGRPVNNDPIVQPCVFATVCVGALQGNSNQPWSGSNFGPGVSIFAPVPATTWVDPAGATPSQPGAPIVQSSFGGTSAAAPLVAGVVAMMKSVNLSLKPSEIRQILKDTAWTQPLSAGGGRVDRWLNAYGAVYRTMNGHIADDQNEFGDNPQFPRLVALQPDGTAIFQSSTLREAKDIDSYALDVADYTNVTITIDYMQDLNTLGVRVESNAKFDAENVNVAASTDRLRWTGMVSPGRHTIVITGGGPNRYDLSIATAPATLRPDRFDRGPFRNNAFVSAAALQTGTYELTLHNAADRDWFSISVPPGMGVPSVSVNSEFPLTLQLVDPVTRAASTQLTDITVGGLSLEPGRDYRIFVDTARPTRYVLSFSDLRKLLEPPAAYLNRDWFEPFNPGDPPPFIHGPWEIWPIQPRPDIRRLLAETPDIKLSLVRSGTGQPIRVSRPDAAGAQVLDLTRLSPDAQYAVIAEYKAARGTTWYPYEFTKTRLRVERR